MIMNRCSSRLSSGLAVVAAVSLGLTGISAAEATAPEPFTAPVDKVSTVGGVEIACTGVGQTRLDPRWQAFPVRVEVSNAKSEYLVGAVVTVSRTGGQPMLSAWCDAPWLLLKLEPGQYVVQAKVRGSAAPRSATIRTPAKGQMRVVLQFTDQ
jgi:hypothetical protein